VLRAVAHDGRALGIADPALRADPEVVRVATAQHPSAWQFVTPEVCEALQAKSPSTPANQTLLQTGRSHQQAIGEVKKAAVQPGEPALKTRRPSRMQSPKRSQEPKQKHALPQMSWQDWVDDPFAS